MPDASCFPIHVSLAGKFGDHGLISVVVAPEDGRAFVIDEYLMSCRVLQRGVEQAAAVPLEGAP
ncbi:MAG: hypothetical protein HOP16_21755 [Acidobacteria bacterium]|nr:hypothetical protein [Acidobacteriota bacterium]